MGGADKMVRVREQTRRRLKTLARRPGLRPLPLSDVVDSLIDEKMRREEEAKKQRRRLRQSGPPPPP